MKFLKTLFLVLLTLSLLGFLSLSVLLHWPVDPPTFPPSPFAPRLISPSKLPKLEMQILDTGYSEVREALVDYGGSWGKKKHYRHAAFWIRHPKGTVIFDGGLGTQLQQELEQAPWYLRFFFPPFILEKPLAQHPIFQTSKSKIDFFLVSHTHWDHLSGMVDFPGVPIRLLPEEIDFLQKEILPSQSKLIREQMQALHLENKPYENFSKSLDLFGDGSLVAVALPGHTPGSLGLFVNLSDGNRFFLVGDAVHGIHPDGSPEARTRLMELFSDDDALEARKTRGKLTELIAHSNEVRLVPTHEPEMLEKYLEKQKNP